MKSLLSFILTSAALAVVKTDMPEVKDIDAGLNFSIPCNLKGPQQTWYWIPSYPICAGVKRSERKPIFIVTSAGERKALTDRFELHSSTERKTNDSKVLTLKFLYMNDSGTFYCSNGKMESPEIKVSVKPGYQNEIVAKFSKKPRQRRWRVNLTCNSCESKALVKTDGTDTTTWKLNGKDVSEMIIIQKWKNTIQIIINPRFAYGLWECSDRACPGQSDGYCLESVPRTSEEFENEETSSFTPNSPDPRKGEVDSRVIAGCVVGLLVLLLVCVVVSVTCRRRWSHHTSPSDTMKEQETRCNKHPTVPEGSPKRRNKEEPGTADHTATAQGAEGIQYSVLQIRETDGHQIQMDKETVIYAEIPINT